MGFLPLPVTCGTSQELSHPSSCQGHQSSAGSGALLHRCQLLSSGGASRKVSRFIQELFCFGTVRGVFSLALTFFFFLTEVVCVSPWHFPSKQLHQKIPDQPSPPPAQLRCGRSTAGCSWRLPQDFPGQAGSSPAPWGSALQQEPWSENSFVLYSLQNPAGAWQQISTPVGC